ncbi:hypothetical protein [Micromonospora sp. NPDC005367]|uniref:hypothetical protein n=1 Tax=Micromonospora sp. NPDC005367 TaxID=3155590 RepID=UPI0033BE849E
MTWFNLRRRTGCDVQELTIVDPRSSAVHEAGVGVDIKPAMASTTRTARVAGVVSPSVRVADHRLVSSELSSLDEDSLVELLDAATPLTTGIGGTTARLEVRGVPVFVKCVPLTDREQLPEHRMSTANVFDLPAFYHYGVGSTGFGAWREWASHRLANAWVLGGRCESFPLMYHWRELPVAPTPRVPPDDIDKAVRYWADSPAVARRLHELAASTASLVLFLEFVPQTWSDWLVERLRQGAPPQSMPSRWRRRPGKRVSRECGCRGWCISMRIPATS